MLAYCAKGLGPNALQSGCRRALRLSGGDMTGCCNAQLQVHCFMPKGFVCKCEPDRFFSKLSSWKRCSCNDQDFQAAVDAELEGEKARVKLARRRNAASPATDITTAADPANAASATQ
eukprot:1872284-Pleurochrysis_carterae.AAC.1